MAIVNGTFTTTGQSPVINGRFIGIRMDFAGTASVDIEVQMPSGAWIKSQTAITADSDQVYDRGGVNTALRLNCTAHTNNVEYWLESI
jgi:hypothetical protein